MKNTKHAYNRKFHTAWRNPNKTNGATKRDAQYWYAVGWRAFQSAHQGTMEKMIADLKRASAVAKSQGDE